MATVFLKEEFLQCSFIAAIDLLALTPFIPLNDLHYLTHEKLHSQQQSAFTTRKRKSLSLFPGRNNFYFHFLYYCVRQRQQHQY